MNLLRSFPVMAYALSLLAIVSFCIGRGDFGFLLVAGVLAALSWYIAEGPRGLTIPKWLGNLLILAASLGMVADLVANRADVIGALGRFSVWLLLIKLYERKDRRDYAQMLWLTAILMLAGILESRSLLFGLSVLLYSGLGLYVLVLYQLYASHEHAAHDRSAHAPRHAKLIPPLRPVIGRSLHAQFIGVAAAMGLVGLTAGMLIFLLTPRNVGAGFMRHLTEVAHQSRTGFVDQVSLLAGVGSRITDSRAPVLTVRATNFEGRGIEAPAGLYLRGAALERYHPDEYRWTALDRTTPSRSRRDFERSIRPITGQTQPGFDQFDWLATLPTNAQRQEALRSAWLIEVSPVSPVGTRAFTMLWPLAISTESTHRYEFDRTTQELLLHDGSGAGYRVWCDPRPDDAVAQSLGAGGAWLLPVEQRYSNPRVRSLAERIIFDADLHPMAPATWPQRGRHARLAAAALVEHFSRGFTYTLDLSNVRIDGDPIASFLFDFRRGHCEFYAAAMTAMLQTLDIEARLVTGFLASEHLGDGRYIVRESHAHAWVEVRTGQFEWTTFDPTPPGELDLFRSPPGTFAERFQTFYETLEIGWMQNIMDYSAQSQQEVQQALNLESFEWLDAMVSGVGAWFDRVQHRFGWVGVLQVFVVSTAVVLAIVIVIRLVRRARRIRRTLQLQHVHGAAYRRMLAQLGFYLDMLDLLRRGGLDKPAWQPPLVFIEQLGPEHARVVPSVRELTMLFYRARYGGHDLSASQRETISGMLHELAATLGVRP